jgi:large subunit ribosomal protein L23
MKKNFKKKMSEERAMNVIKKPMMTEKSTNLNQFNQYSFIVSNDSNSFEIKKAIEQIFKVKVTKVNTAIIHGKLKSFKGKLGYKKDFKKAIVTLAEGNTIDTSLEIK